MAGAANEENTSDGHRAELRSRQRCQGALESADGGPDCPDDAYPCSQDAESATEQCGAGTLTGRSRCIRPSDVTGAIQDRPRMKQAPFGIVSPSRRSIQCGDVRSDKIPCVLSRSSIAV